MPFRNPSKSSNFMPSILSEKCRLSISFFAAWKHPTGATGTFAYQWGVCFRLRELLEIGHFFFFFLDFFGLICCGFCALVGLLVDTSRT